MPKFRKKPIEIEAVQFTGIGSDPPGVFRREEDDTPYVVTIHDQRVYLSPGDWVVPEPDGVHYYPIKPEVFAANYEPSLKPPLAGPDAFSIETIEKLLTLADVPESLDRLQEHRASPAGRLEVVIAERDRYRLMLDVALSDEAVRRRIGALVDAEDRRLDADRDAEPIVELALLRRLSEWPARDIAAEIATARAKDGAMRRR